MLTAILALLVLAGGITVLSLSGRQETVHVAPPVSPVEQARRDARTFLSRYVTHDGRVVRWDEGGDTVSEGEGYALLVAVALGDRTEFARIWHWDEKHLQLPDGLFAYHWARGRVTGKTPAADADLDTAWALVLAGKHFPDAAYTAQGLRVANSVLQDETVTAAGHLELVAGPWARAEPATVDGSYMSPEAMAALATASGSTSWLSLESDSTTLVEELEGADRTHLPSNWARLTADGGVRPTGPQGKGIPLYGLDAQRIPVWFAADCSATGRTIAKAEWPTLSRAADNGGRISYRLDGRAASASVNPLGYLGAAAAADAAGHRSQARSLLERADRQNDAYHTYYGAAWLALGTILLDTRWLSPCPPG